MGSDRMPLILDGTAPGQDGPLAWMDGPEWQGRRRERAGAA